MSEIFIFSIIAFASYLGVEGLRRWSLRHKRFDIPNERSSHSTPTPRGGGLIIVLLGLAAYAGYTLSFGDTFVWAYVVGAALVAGISWLDDLYTISFVWRFAVHVAAALLVIISVGFFQEFYIPWNQTFATGEIGGIILTFLWIVWLTNAYNFMDGIDGIAGLQCVVCGIGWFVIGVLLGGDSAGFLGGAVAFAAFGFLIQNWQPAKIFMGDVGSAFLGYTFAVLPLLLSREIGVATENLLLPMIAVAFNWLFVFDTIYTFIRRLLNRERFWEAHRGHLYQKFIIAGFSHQSVTILYGTLTILTTLATIGWTIKRGFGELVLLSVVVSQSIGLLICLRIVQNNPNNPKRNADL